MRQVRTRRDDPDATVRRSRPADTRRATWIAGLAATALLCSLLAVRAWRPYATRGTVRPPLADPAALLAAPTDATRLYRFGSMPSVTVVLFDSAHDQALALNRVGAFVEKAGVPHDRVLEDDALHTAITASGDDFDTYYLGHDYRAADLRRFFADADRGQVALRPAETWLRARLTEGGLLSDGAPGAVISLPPATAGGLVDASGRSTILRHELSHGLYFTDARYAAYVARFWDDALTGDERAVFVRFLAHQGYDSADADLMRNECQAYLVFTDDPRYFSAAALGLPEQHVAAMRASFLAGVPKGLLEAAALR